VKAKGKAQSKAKGQSHVDPNFEEGKTAKRTQQLAISA
jgi:hypothetical protein